MERKKDLSTYGIAVHPCDSCPFAGKEAVQLAPEQLKYYYKQLLNGSSQHICHSARKTICRGGRIIQLRWFYSLGLITEPTDEAFNQAITDANEYELYNPNNTNMTNYLPKVVDTSSVEPKLKGLRPSKKSQIAVRIPPSLFDKLKRYIHETGISQTDVVVSALAKQLDSVEDMPTTQRLLEIERRLSLLEGKS